MHKIDLRHQILVVTDDVMRFRRERIFHDRRLPLEVRLETSQQAYPAHDHDFIEIVLTVSGSAVQRTAHRSLAMKPGMVTVLRPGHWHEYLNCRRLAIYNCCFGPELLRNELAWLLQDPALGRLLWGKGRDASIFQLVPRDKRRLAEILEMLAEQEAASHGVKISLLCLFLTTLAGLLPENEESPAPVVVHCLRQIEAELAHPWTIQELARSNGCTPEYLIRLFQRGLGLSPYAYISRCRAERAAALLLRSDFDIATIASKVGWPEPCHFARRFKCHFGLSAREYRRQMVRPSGLTTPRVVE